MNAKDSRNTSRTNWVALEAMDDEAIDYSDIPPLTEEFFEKATLRIPASQAHRLVLIKIFSIGSSLRVKNTELQSIRFCVAIWKRVTNKQPHNGNIKLQSNELNPDNLLTWEEVKSSIKRQ